MEDYPRNLMELEKEFSTEAACIEYLFRLRWPDGFICPRCDNPKGWFTNRGLCKCTECGYQASVKAGTIFERSRLPLTIWFRTIWWVTSQKNGASAKGLQRVLGLSSYETAWTWLHKLRRAMVRPGRDRLKGIIEMDEVFIGGKKSGKRGRGAEGKALVLIAAQIDGDRTGRIRLRRIKDASGASIDTAVQEMVEPGSVVKADDWQGYNNLKQLGYVRQIVYKKADVGTIFFLVATGLPLC